MFASRQDCGDALKDLETELQAAEKTEASKGAAHKAEREALTSHDKRALLLERAVRDDDGALKAKREALHQVTIAEN